MLGVVVATRGQDVLTSLTCEVWCDVVITHSCNILRGFEGVALGERRACHASYKHDCEWHGHHMYTCRACVQRRVTRPTRVGGMSPVWVNDNHHVAGKTCVWGVSFVGRYLHPSPVRVEIHNIDLPVSIYVVHLVGSSSGDAVSANSSSGPPRCSSCLEEGVPIMNICTGGHDSHRNGGWDGSGDRRDGGCIIC
jgi:hypothetical protein